MSSFASWNNADHRAATNRSNSSARNLLHQRRPLTSQPATPAPDRSVAGSTVVIDPGAPRTTADTPPRL
ncbi:hypothetical protein ACRAWF_03605 [Streptomyces sp. L7]